MPLPIVFIGIAAATGAAGAGAAVKAGVDHNTTKKINSNTEERIVHAAVHLEELRRQCGEALKNLGREKVQVLSGSLLPFVDAFAKLKNVDFTESSGLLELSKLRIDRASFEKVGPQEHFGVSLAGGSLAGLTGGALAAFGAYSAASTFAVASTGTAISSLSGAAATNATLAFFGGGSLASGGLGMAGGTAVLGGLDRHCWSWVLSWGQKSERTWKRRNGMPRKQTSFASNLKMASHSAWQSAEGPGCSITFWQGWTRSSCLWSLTWSRLL